MHKHLFHIDQKNAIQFVTFRTQQSILYYLEKHNIKVLEHTAQRQFHLDKFLDRSNAGASLNNEIIHLLITFLKSNDSVDYNLIAVSIMANHIHLLFQQLRPLAEIMPKIKGATAFLINKHNKQSGILWDKGYFDKVVRSEKQFQITYQYIKNNAHSAGLKDAEHRFYGIYEEL